MKQKQKGFAPIVITLAVLVLAVVLGASYYFLNKNKESNPLNQQEQIEKESVPQSLISNYSNSIFKEINASMGESAELTKKMFEVYSPNGGTSAYILRTYDKKAGAIVEVSSVLESKTNGKKQLATFSASLLERYSYEAYSKKDYSSAGFYGENLWLLPLPVVVPIKWINNEMLLTVKYDADEIVYSTIEIYGKDGKKYFSQERINQLGLNYNSFYLTPQNIDNWSVFDVCEYSKDKYIFITNFGHLDWVPSYIEYYPAEDRYVQMIPNGNPYPAIGCSDLSEQTIKEKLRIDDGEPTKDDENVNEKPITTGENTPTSIPSLDKQYNVPVLSLSYLPLDNEDQSKINLDIVGPYLSEGTSVEEIKQKIKRINGELIAGLEAGSSFHLYKDNSSKSALKYSIADSKEFLRPILRTNNSKWLFLDQGDWGLTADHYTELSSINICDYVDNKGIKEVWIWMYHYGPDTDKDGKADLDANRYHVSPAESNMSSKYGDISNSNRIDDLPLCKNTYTVYEYNYTRDFGEAIEDHTHQIEALMRHADEATWNKFVGLESGSAPFACGWTHCPPNVMSVCSSHNYDWKNETVVSSNCENWTENGKGEVKNVSCHTWAGNNCDSKSGDKFKVWWMQNIPRDWFVFVGDFDNAMKSNLKLSEKI